MIPGSRESRVGCEPVVKEAPQRSANEATMDALRGPGLGYGAGFTWGRSAFPVSGIRVTEGVNAPWAKALNPARLRAAGRWARGCAKCFTGCGGGNG